MSKQKRLDEHMDELRVGVTLHPDADVKYQHCRRCFNGECSNCEFNPSGEPDVMSQFLRPRFPFPNL